MHSNFNEIVLEVILRQRKYSGGIPWNEANLGSGLLLHVLYAASVWGALQIGLACPGIRSHVLSPELLPILRAASSSTLPGSYISVLIIYMA